MGKIRVGIVFGGKSAEHEVSLQSAQNIISAIDRETYDVVLIGVNKNGRWQVNDENSFLLNKDDPQKIALQKSNHHIAVLPGEGHAQIIDQSTQEPLPQIDVIFPIIHGTLGEDGSIQGLLRTLNLPFVGVDLLGSAVSMDKDFTKRILRDAGISVAKGLVYKAFEQSEIDFSFVKSSLGLPLFIKPVNQGSSVGVNKVETEAEFDQAIVDAFKYDDKILIEEAIVGREIECAILGNNKPIASMPGEILPTSGFYSYESKYIDELGATLSAPADLTNEQTKAIQDVSLHVFKALDCEGMARVDFFMKENGELIVNEVNTVPGFTKISMYPRLWEVSGLSYPALVDRLIKLAFERHQRKQQLKSAVFE